MNSIRRRLITSLLLTLFGGSLVICLSTYLNARGEVDELFDNNLKQVALTLQTRFAATGLGASIVDVPALSQETAIEEEEEFAIQVWNVGDGALIYSSHPKLLLPRQTGRGFHDFSYEGSSWRSYVAEAPQNVIQVSQPMNSRIDMMTEIALNIMVPILLLMPLLAPLNWWVVSRSLRPLSAVSSALEKRTPDSLEPLSPDHAPQEIRALIQALNDLLQRLQQALSAQRRFIADAAHELRTPLTAVQLQADLLERADSEEERRTGMKKLKSGIARSAHLVQQLLTLARQEPTAAQRPFTSVSLEALAKVVIEQNLPMAESKGITLALNSQEAVSIQGDKDNLQILLGNLVDNALRYTPAQGSVTLVTGVENGRPFLAVQDTGPGIPADEREHVFDRFYRVEGTGSSGTGLGLAIAKSIAEQHHAEIRISEGLGGKGTEVRIVFA